MPEARINSGPTGFPARVAAAGLLYALLLGLISGWLRYWEGLFVLFQGAGCGLLVAWLTAKTSHKWGQIPYHPGLGTALGLAFLWWAVFLFGQAVGFGLAQPWFEPLGWLGRVWAGRSSEFAFGVATTAGVSRSFSMGARGWLWLVLNTLDWLIMLFFLLAMPWKQRPGRGKSAPESGNEAASC